MKVNWIKTYTIGGSLEVPDDVDEETQKQLARNHAADNTDVTITELDWVETQFYSNKPQCEDEVSSLEDETDKYYDWFNESGW